tara:strand:- start:20791 stop:21483 length:693 start_codon:yes stop_codon:yes gene_type:complete
MNDIAREAAGQPSGGQFSSLNRTEAGITLTQSDSDYNAAGTFLFPPKPRSSGQHISFWENCAVGDDILENVALGYEKWAFAWHQGQQNIWLEQNYYPKQGIDVFAARAGQLTAAQEEARDIAAENYSATILDYQHPRRIDSLDTRDVARAGQMYFYATDLEISERSRVDDHMIELRMGPITVVDIVRKYNLDGLRPFFTGQTRALVESLDQVRIEAESHSAAIISAMRGD